MKGKYKELGPLLQKVNQASAQKKKLELRIKELLDELKRARMSLVDSQLNFSKLVKELILKKENLDKRLVLNLYLVERTRAVFAIVSFRLSKVKATTFKRPLPSSTPVKGAKVEEEIIPLEPLPKVIDELQLGAQEEAAANNNEEKTDKNDFIEYISPLGGVASSRLAKKSSESNFEYNSYYL